MIQSLACLSLEYHKDSIDKPPPPIDQKTNKPWDRNLCKVKAETTITETLYGTPCYKHWQSNFVQLDSFLVLR